MNRYLRERGDANIKTNASHIAKGTFDDANFPIGAPREQAGRATAYDTASRMHALRCRRCS